MLVDSASEVDEGELALRLFNVVVPSGGSGLVVVVFGPIIGFRVVATVSKVVLLGFRGLVESIMPVRFDVILLNNQEISSDVLAVLPGGVLPAISIVAELTVKVVEIKGRINVHSVHHLLESKGSVKYAHSFFVIWSLPVIKPIRLPSYLREQIVVESNSSLSLGGIKVDTNDTSWKLIIIDTCAILDGVNDSRVLSLSSTVVVLVGDFVLIQVCEGIYPVADSPIDIRLNGELLFSSVALVEGQLDSVELILALFVDVEGGINSESGLNAGSADVVGIQNLEVEFLHKVGLGAASVADLVELDDGLSVNGVARLDSLREVVVEFSVSGAGSGLVSLPLLSQVVNQEIV